MSTVHWTRPHHLIRTASVTAIMSGTGAVTGLVLDAIVLYAFGAGPETDALFAALTLPTLLNGIVFIQSPKILVPAFGALFERGEETRAWLLLSNLLTLCAVVFAGVSLAGALLSSVIVPLQIPGLAAPTIALAVKLSRVLFLLTTIQGLSCILLAVLYARHAFVMSSSSKLFINVSTIALVLLGHGRFGIQAVAWGMVIGSLVQLAIAALALRTHGFRYRWTLTAARSEVRDIVMSFGFPLAGHVLGESGFIVQNIIGSYLGSGSLTLLRYASRMVQAVAGILLGSVVQAVMPTMARHAAAQDLTLQRKTLLQGIQLLALAGVPVCIWLIAAAEPLVTLLFKRGQFTSADATATALILQLMVPDLLLGRLVSITQTLFYANGDRQTPFVSTVIFTVANLFFAVALSRWLGAPGVGLAVSLASMCNAGYMLAKVQSRFSPVGWGRMRTFGLRLGTISLVAFVVFVVGARVFSGLSVAAPLKAILAVALPGSLGFCVFGLGVFAFRLFDERIISPVGTRAT